MSKDKKSGTNVLDDGDFYKSMHRLRVRTLELEEKIKGMLQPFFDEEIENVVIHTDADDGYLAVEVDGISPIIVNDKEKQKRIYEETGLEFDGYVYGCLFVFKTE